MKACASIPNYITLHSGLEEMNLCKTKANIVYSVQGQPGLCESLS